MTNFEEKITRRKLKTSYLTTVVSITLVLVMLGLLGLILIHAKKLSDFVKENIGISVIIKENVKEIEILELQKTLDAATYVKATEYVTKEEAAKRLKEDLGEDFINFLGYNPLLPSVDIHLKAEWANNDSISKIEKRLLNNDKVKEVFYQKSTVHMVNENVRKISIVLLAFSLLLLIIAIALINNTIRLSVYSKRFLLKSMMLVGATQYFIRKPFVIRGIIQGLISSGIAIILLCGTLYLTQREVPELVDLRDINIFLVVFGSVIVLGILISWASTYLAVRKYLRMRTDELYY